MGQRKTQGIEGRANGAGARRHRRWTPGRRGLRAVAVVAALPWAISQAYAVQVTATWGSPSSGSYATPTDWDIGLVPLNNANTTYIVEIGTGKTVSYTVANPQTIDGFLLDSGSSFNLSSSSAVIPTSLQVLGTATIAGTINANNASFTALASGTNFVGTTNAVSAVNGGVVAIAATAFNATGLANATIINAAGAGSLVDLSSVQTLNVGQGSGYNDYITATTGAKIKLSGVTTLVAPASTAGLVVNVNGGADIDLSSLKTIGGVTTDSGRTYFNLDGATTTVGPVQKANQLYVNLQNASTMTLGGYSGSAAVTNSTFTVAGGSTLDASALAGSLTERGLANTTLLSAAGSGSFIDLSKISTLDVGQGSGYNDYITATTGSRIDLSGVKTLIAPSSTAGLVFTANGGADIDLSSLQTVGGVTVDSGRTYFNLDGATTKIGPLQKANQLYVNLQNASVMTLGGYAGSAAVTNSTFTVAGGSTLDASSLAGSLTERGLANTTLLSAAGSDSLLDLSKISTLDAGQGSGYNDMISATTGAKIKLSGVTALVAPASTAGLVFTVNSGADIDLSSLQTIGGVTVDSGRTYFNLDGATATVGPLQKANQLYVNLQNASVMTLGGYAGSAAVTNSTFTVAGGSTLDASSLAGSLSERGLANTVLMSAADAGSLLDLSKISTLDVGQGSGYNDYITATTGAKINLSGVRTLVAPASTAGVVFTANSGADINLSSLQTIGGVTVDSGRTYFNLDGATTAVGPLQKANQLYVNLQNASAMTLGGYAGAAAITNSTFTVAGGSTLNASSLAGSLTERGLANTTLLSAAGSGSLIDLSKIATLDVGQGSGYNDYITATTGAKIKLSGVTTLVAPTSTAAIVFTANSGGSIDLSSLQTISNPTGGQVDFNVASGGSMTLHALDANPGVHFNLTDAGSTLNVVGDSATTLKTNSLAAAQSTGNLNLLAGSTMAAGAGTTVNISGSFSFQQTVESQVNLDAATLAFGGSNGHSLEIGGKNNNTPTTGSVVTGNFAIGQLIVGSAGLATVVSLEDQIDNGNRAGGSEALYLNGNGSSNGLHILGGSTLVLDDLDLYTSQNGLWVHINDEFKNGVTRIAFDQGYIAAAVPEPGTFALLGAGLAAIGWRRRGSQARRS